jgi:phenylacetate-CoA ligase
MTRNPAAERQRLRTLDRDALERHQLARLNSLLDRVLPENRFYAEKFAGRARPLASLAELAELPFTGKEELLGFGLDEPAAHLTYPLERYVRYHQTSGTQGHPLKVLDTAEDWQWFLDCWQYTLDAADVTLQDRLLLAFSFGPFIGFWSAFEAGCQRGCLVIPAGGMTTRARLELLRTSGATVLFCTPTYSLHLLEVAAAAGVDTRNMALRRVILAGEPGGSIPATRARLEESWQAKVIDHSGATEVGPWGFGDPEGRGLYILESEFIAEFLSVETDKPAAEGELSELVLTCLGRTGSPVIRYRTGDLVRPTWEHGEDVRFVRLAGGVLGRRDDMVIIRGVNIFPSSVEQILRTFAEIAEFRIVASKAGALDQLSVEVEDRANNPERVAEELRLRLGIRVDVTAVPPGTLPRFEAKAKRFVDQRGQGSGAGGQGPGKKGTVP